jgi:hypothetical protein
MPPAQSPEQGVVPVLSVVSGNPAASIFFNSGTSPHDVSEE